MGLPPQAFFTTQKFLLDAEQATEVAENALLLSSAPPTVLARAGLAIVNLSIKSLRTGLGGRTVIELGLDSAYHASDAKAKNKALNAANDGLPEHGIRTGDIVRMGELPKGTAKKADVAGLKDQAVEGVVTRVTEKVVCLVAGKSGESDSNDTLVDALASRRLWLVKLANDVTYKRMGWAMGKLLKNTDEGFSSLQRVLLGLSSPSEIEVSNVGPNLRFINDSLNDSQKEAVRFALAAPQLALIHGPPGTGKTSTIVELILQVLKLGQRALVCGPSNVSVDNIVERLAVSSPATQTIRLGHPARLLPTVLDRSLEVLTRTSDAGSIVKDIREEIDQKIANTRKSKNTKERKAIWQDVKELRKEFRQRETKCIDNLITGSEVVLATLHGAGSKQVEMSNSSKGFDVIIIDEAGQGLEAACWIPIVAAASNAQKLVLAGDNLQLPPTVKSSDVNETKADRTERSVSLHHQLVQLSLDDAQIRKASHMSLDYTMFDRLLKDHGAGIKKLLTTQYRMHEKIMRFPSDQLYDARLVAAKGVATWLLKDLRDDIQDTDDTREPIVFYDTQGGDFPEKSEDLEKGKGSVLLGDSKSNDFEAALVVMHVQNLIRAGVQDVEIAVITPYNAQVAVLHGLCRDRFPNLEIGSVDGFQGREKEAIIVSLVRSNNAREVGFLSEKRRLNVAMTRAKRHLCVVGDSETVGHGGSFLKKWMQHLEENADLRYPAVSDLESF